MCIGQDGETALEVAEKKNRNDAADAMKSFTVNYVRARVFVCCGVCLCARVLDILLMVTFNVF